MFKQIVHLLRTNRIYSAVTIGLFVSSIGTGLTQVAVYGELSHLHATPLAFTLAFSFSMLPGLVSSRIGAHLAGKWKWARLLSVSELAGAASVALPVLGTCLRSIPILLASQLFPAFLGGLAFPVIQKFVRIHCHDKEMAAVSVLESYLFSAQVILGFGVGTLLYGQVGADTYFALDVLSYLLSAGVILIAARSLRSPISPPKERFTQDARQSDGRMPWSALSPERRRAFFLLPVLSILGTPAVSLLPAIGMRFGTDVRALGLLLTPSLVFIFAKTLGQLIGPLLISPGTIEKNFNNDRLIFGCALGFIGLYICASRIESMVLALAIIVLAHTLSNIIYVIGTYSSKVQFTKDEIAYISSRQYQLQLAAGVTLSFIAGEIADYLPISLALVSSVPIAITVWQYMKRAGTPSVQTELG